MSSIISNYCIASVQNHSNLFSFTGALTLSSLTDKKTTSSEGLQLAVVSQGATGGFKPVVIDELESAINKERGIIVQFKSSSDLENFSRSKFSCFSQFCRLDYFFNFQVYSSRKFFFSIFMFLSKLCS